MNNLKVLSFSVLSKVMPFNKPTVAQAISSRYAIQDVQAPANKESEYKEAEYFFGSTPTKLKYLSLIHI